MTTTIVSRLIILIFGTLYPAYASYKAVKTKNVKEYVKWMMYWIVFALFTCVETFADILVSFWFPFYYEIKIIFVIWLLSPATKGSSILYRRFVHPQLNKHEKEIDDYIIKARDQGYTAVLQLGSKGLSFATSMVMQTAIMGQETLIQHIKKSYSMNDISNEAARAPNPNTHSISCDEADGFEEQTTPIRQRSKSENIYDDEMSAENQNFDNSINQAVTSKETPNNISKARGSTKRSSYREVSGYATLPRNTRSKTKS